MVLWLTQMKKIIVNEFTVPWEERCGATNEIKKGKYGELLAECREKGWKTWNLPVEIVCRRFYCTLS